MLFRNDAVRVAALSEYVDRRDRRQLRTRDGLVRSGQVRFIQQLEVR